MSKPPRLTIVTSHKYWIEPFLPFFERNYRVKLLYLPPLPPPDSMGHLLKLISSALARRFKRFWVLKRSHVIFVEWANDQLVAASRIAGKRILVSRLHRYEIFNLPSETNWSKVDAMVVVIDAIGRQLEEKVPELNGRVHTIHNYMDLDQWQDRQDRKLTYRLGIVGHVVSRKCILELITLFKQLHGQEPRLTLHITGKWSSPEYLYIINNQIGELGLEGSVKVEGYVDDLGAFYRSLDVILSFSHHESTQLTLFEGLACGAMPLSFKWDGVEEFLPQANLFSDYSTFQERVRDFYGLSDEQRGILVERLQQEVLPAFTQPDPRETLLALLTGLSGGP